MWSFQIPSGVSGAVVSQNMADATDGGGYQIIMTNGHYGTYDFDNVRQFNHDGAVIIGVCKLYNGNGIFGIGFRGDGAGARNRSTTKLLMEGSNGYGNIRGYTADASGESAHDTGMSADGNWHSLKIEMTPTITTFSVDGILSGNGYDASKGSENELDEKCHPMIYASASGSGSGGNRRYLEAYNT